MNSISVNEAIKKGRWQLFWIPLFILLGCVAICVIGLIVFDNNTMWNSISWVFGLVCGPLFSMLYYVIALPRWRIWAFSNVRNVHELKQVAKLNNIYPEDESFLWRLEIKSAEQKRQIEELQRKFDQPDVFEDDYTLPYETTYSYSKSDNLSHLLITLALAIGSVVLLTRGNSRWGIMMLVCSLIFAVATYKRFKTNGPVLVISNDGITTIDNGFHSWKDIKNEQLYSVSAGKASDYGLSYEVNGNTIKMSFKELYPDKIDHVLRTYRGRYQASHAPKGTNGITHIPHP